MGSCLGENPILTLGFLFLKRLNEAVIERFQLFPNVVHPPLEVWNQIALDFSKLKAMFEESDPFIEGQK